MYDSNKNKCNAREGARHDASVSDEPPERATLCDNHLDKSLSFSFSVVFSPPTIWPVAYSVATFVCAQLQWRRLSAIGCRDHRGGGCSMVGKRNASR